MDEVTARDGLQRLARGEAPPARIDIGLAMRKGRTRLRWLLAAIAGRMPVLAAAGAVVAIGLGALPSGAGGQRPLTAREAPATAPHWFNPLVPYATFGWLPPGRHITQALTSAASEDLEVGPSGSPRSWDLMVRTAGACNYTSGQLLKLLSSNGRPTLKCTLNWDAFGGRPTLANQVIAVAPPVNGHRAFWERPVCNTNQCDLGRARLVWSYAPGGWAQLSGPSRADALKIAGNVTFGAAAGQKIRFPVTVTGVPPSWRVTVVQSAQIGGALVAQQWTLGKAAAAPMFGVYPQAPVKGPCPLLPASAARHQIINGFRVTTTVTAQGSQVCASSAGGLSVYIHTGAKVAPDAVAIFARHLRLLGGNTAGWTTRPPGLNHEPGSVRVNPCAARPPGMRVRLPRGARPAPAFRGCAGLASAIDRPGWLSYSERRAVFWCSPPWPGTAASAPRVVVAGQVGQANPVHLLALQNGLPVERAPTTLCPPEPTPI